MRFGGLVINTVVCLTLAKWETVSGQFGGYLSDCAEIRTNVVELHAKEFKPSGPMPRKGDFQPGTGRPTISPKQLVVLLPDSWPHAHPPVPYINTLGENVEPVLNA